MFTNREKEILELVAQGLENSEIAKRLFLSNATVKTHLHNIYLKTDLNEKKSSTQRVKLVLIWQEYKNDNKKQ